MSFPRWSSIEHLQSAIAEGKITAKEATKQYLESIERQKDLNAVTAVNPKALEEAEALDVRSYHAYQPYQFAIRFGTVNLYKRLTNSSVSAL